MVCESDLFSINQGPKWVYGMGPYLCSRCQNHQSSVIYLSPLRLLPYLHSTHAITNYFLLFFKVAHIFHLENLF